MRSLPHPGRDQIDIATVLDALSDPTRLAIVADLASRPAAGIEACCGDFAQFGSKPNLTYHLAKLREAGITQTRIDGTLRRISLRRDDLDALFPGLLDSIIAGFRARQSRAHSEPAQAG